MHAECVSYAPVAEKIGSSKLSWGGPRPNSGGPRPNSGGARPNSGGARPGAGRPRSVLPVPRAPAVLGQRWFCIQTFPRAEELAISELLAQGFEAHLPRERTERLVRRFRKPDEFVVTIKPFFRGYLFARFDREVDYWRPIASTAGVRRIFGTAPERPTPVPVGVVEALIARSAPDGIIDGRSSMVRLEAILVGEKVRFLEGPFADLTAVCTWSNSKRVRLLMEVMGGPQTVEIARELVAPTT